MMQGVLTGGWPPLLAILILALAACAAPGGSPSLAVSAGATAPASDASGIEAGPVEIGDGRSIYRDCRGEGSPTVILESGDGADASQWSQVIARIAEVTKVCAYDRGGLGRSDPVTGCRHLEDLTGDLAHRVGSGWAVRWAAGAGALAASWLFVYSLPRGIAGMPFSDA